MRLLQAVLLVALAGCARTDYGAARAAAISSGATAINQEAGNYGSYAEFMAANDSPFRDEIAEMGLTEPSQVHCAAKVATKHLLHPDELADLDAAITGQKPITAQQYKIAVSTIEYRLSSSERVSAMESEMLLCK